VFAGAAVVISIAYTSTRSRLPEAIFGVAASVVLAIVLPKIQVGAGTAIAVWSDQFADSFRLSIVVMMCDALWFAVVLPAAVLSYPSVVGPRAAGGLRIEDIYAALLVVPMMTATMLSRLYDVPIVDELTRVWWFRKITVVLLGAVLIEEVVFRGWLYDTIKRSLRQAVKKDLAWITAAVASSAVFGCVHLGAGVIPSLQAFLAGVVYCAVVEKTGRLAWCVFGHLLYNMMFTSWN
jgi:membrane protease YdiL (CAAX protease family)